VNGHVGTNLFEKTQTVCHGKSFAVELSLRALSWVNFLMPKENIFSAVQ